MKLHHITTVQWALGISIAVHAMVLTVRFVDPEAFNRVFEDQPLEVILVNTQSKEKPDKAQAIAQTSMAGGGNVEQGRATTFLPPSQFTDEGDAQENSTARKLQTLEEQQNLLLSQVKDLLAALPPQRTSQQPRTTDQTQSDDKRRQLLKLLGEIERRITMENARPKKRYVSPAVKEGLHAIYYDHFRQVVEARGTDNFPQSGGKKLYGELTMIVTVNHDGRVLSTEIAQGSGNPTLDKRAQNIVRSTGSFGKFTPDMRRQFDQLVVVSRFKFTRDATLQASVSASP